jgi:general secretion pathway protein K
MMRSSSRPASARRRAQRGAALLTAMVIVTLVATLAASMIWQQWRAVQVETAERARVQSAWILSGALDWARLILREDRRTGAIDHLGEPWAVPLAEARLSTFLAADRNNTDDGPEAFLSGRIVDAQSRYNLRNLIAKPGPVDPKEQQVLERLCELAGIAPGVASRIALGLREASNQQASETQDDSNAPLLPKTVAQLVWLGLEPAAVDRLSSYVVLLPRATKLDVNTASREIIAAVAGVDLGSAERLVQTRQRTPFATLDDALRQLPSAPEDASGRLDISSQFFEVSGRLRLGDRILEQRSLVERKGNDVIQLWRERASLLGTQQ